jgi:dTDP-4-dehydrorhamnose reductase
VKVLVLGASGMLGHKVLEVLSRRFETHGTVRSQKAVLTQVAPDAAGVIEGVSATDLESVTRAVAQVRPEAIVNCIGIVKQLDEAKDPIPSILVNSLFPHQLAGLSRTVDARLIHVSTDCVFSGRVGNYTEDDTPDPVDLYGRSKLLGESAAPQVLTIRTSIVGRELEGAHGLLEWFLNQRHGTVRGFRRAVFSGWSTTALARAIGDVLETQPDLAGLWHVAATPSTKFDLLSLVRNAFELDVAIEPDEDFACNRSLDGSRFRVRTGITAPEWPEMVDELREESAFYDALREPTVARR